LKQEQIDFLKLAVQPALDNEKAFGIPASITIAQAILESGWGRSKLFTEAHNPFGIKYSHRQGVEQYGSYDAPTKEYAPGSLVAEKIDAQFQRFPSLHEAFTAPALLLQRPRYITAYEERNDWKKFAECLGPKTPDNPGACGYSTEPQYSADLVKLIDQYHLDDLRTLEVYKAGPKPGAAAPGLGDPLA
jgi:flagellum-specific peptidoglycan hydrolase FlgJ